MTDAEDGGRHVSRLELAKSLRRREYKEQQLLFMPSVTLLSHFLSSKSTPYGKAQKYFVALVLRQQPHVHIPFA